MSSTMFALDAPAHHSTVEVAGTGAATPHHTLLFVDSAEANAPGSVVRAGYLHVGLTRVATASERPA